MASKTDPAAFALVSTVHFICGKRVTMATKTTEHYQDPMRVIREAQQMLRQDSASADSEAPGYDAILRSTARKLSGLENLITLAEALGFGDQ